MTRPEKRDGQANKVRRLLPGITNVTDRARDYWFHPWVVWASEQRYADHSVEAFRRVLGRM